MDNQIDGLPAAIGADRDIGLNDRLTRIDGLMNAGPEIGSQSAARQAEDIRLRRADRELQILAGPARGMDQFAVAVDNDESRRIAVEQLALGQALQAFLLASRRR